MKSRMSVLVSLVCLVAGFGACRTPGSDTGGDRPSPIVDAGTGGVSAPGSDTGGDRPNVDADAGVPPGTP